MFIPEADYRRIQTLIPIVCVDLLIVHEDRCLLMKREREPAKGLYWFPGGRINRMETIRDAALRKAREETNLDCEFQDTVSIEETLFEGTEGLPLGAHTVNICCFLRARSVDGLTIDGFHSDYAWVSPRHIPPDLMLHPAVENPLRRLGDRMGEETSHRR